MSTNDPMVYNFELMKKRIMDTLALTDVNKYLNKIKGSTIFVGSGGSKVVASYASLVFNLKNNCCTCVGEPRDVLYENIRGYKNIFVCSYSGDNHGVDCLANLKLNKYLFTYGDVDKDGYKKVKCNSSISKEKSFISLAATLMPMSVLLEYYLGKNCDSLVEEMIDNASKMSFKVSNINLPFDVISGKDTLTSEIYLDSTFVESGLGSLVRHSKYDFCHGRTTLAFHSDRNLIYLVANDKELDTLLLDKLSYMYKDIIVLRSSYNDLVIDNYYLTMQALFLTKYLAERKDIDLSIVDYNKELCKVLYKYKGKM